MRSDKHYLLKEVTNYTLRWMFSNVMYFGHEGQSFGTSEGLASCDYDITHSMRGPMLNSVSRGDHFVFPFPSVGKPSACP